MKLLKSLKLGVAGLLLSCGAQATPINIGGVVWNPDAVNSFPVLKDFVMNGSIFEETAFTAGDIVTGRGKANQINNSNPNTLDFCPGCELTFTFSMELVEFNFGTGSFKFKDLIINFFVDHTPNYDGSYTSAADSDTNSPWLVLATRVDEFLTGNGTNLGTGSDSGSGSANLDAIGGLAKNNFDTNKKLGYDAILSSSFQPLDDGDNTLYGTFDIKADTIPEPMPLAILGLGLLGLAASRRQAK